MARKKDKLYTANKWNQPLFAKGVDRIHHNIFDGMFSSTLNTPTSLSSTSGLFQGNSGLNYQTPQLTQPNTSMPIDWSNAGQRIQATQGVNAMVNNFGSDAANNNPFSQYSTSNTSGSGSAGKVAALQALKGVGLELAGTIGKSEKNKRGLWDAADPIHQLAGGRESTVGNALGDAGVSVFKAGAQSGNGMMMLGGAALKVAGGLGNAAFGIKTDKERLNNINAGVESLKNFSSNASSFDEIQGPNAIVNNTAGVYKGGWFSGGRARRKNEQLNRQVTQAESWANRSVDNNIDNIAKTQMDTMAANYAAMGGFLDTGNNMSAINYNFMSDYLTSKNKAAESKNRIPSNVFGNLAVTPLTTFALGGDMQTNGSDFSNGLTHIDEGGSHEQNPYEGVQVGISRDNGQPNLVEEGETIFDDYVFSRRIKPDARTKKKFHVGKNSDMSFADLSKKLEKESEERPNDAISQAGLTKQMHELADEQERQKEEQQKAEMEAAFAQLPPEQQQALMEQVAMQEQQAEQQPEMVQVDGLPEDEESEVNAYGGPINMYGNGGKKGEAFDYGAKGTDFNYGEALEWLKENHPNLSAQTMQKMVRIMQKAAIPDTRRNYSFLYSKNVPTFNFSDSNIAKYFSALVKQGISTKDAYEMVYPSATRRGKEETSIKEYNDKYQKLVSAYNATNKPKPHRTVWRAHNGKIFNTRQEALQENASIRTSAAKAKQEAAANAKVTASTVNTKDKKGNSPTKKVPVTAEPAKATTIGSIPGITPYSYYTNGSDGYSTPTGFKVEEGGKAYDYTDDYKNLVNTLGADDIRSWAKEHPEDLSLASFLARGNNLDKLTDEQWRQGATDGKYGFMHHVANNILEEDTPIEDATIEDATNFGDYDPNYTPEDNWIDINEDAGEDTFVEVDENGNPVDKKKLAPNHKPTWGRYAGLFGPAVGLGMQLAGIGKPDYSRMDAAVEASSGAPALAQTKYLGNYLRYNPMDIWYEQNRLNANSRATDRAILNNASPLGTKMAGLLANGYNNQIASGNLYRQALEYNDALRQKVAEFNRGTDQFNAQAFNDTSKTNAQLQNNHRNFKAQMMMDAARQRMASDAAWNQGIYGNVQGLFKGLSDWGKENAQHNMIADMAADGIFGNMSDSQNIGKGYLTTKKAKKVNGSTKAARGGRIDRKKGRRGLTF